MLVQLLITVIRERGSIRVDRPMVIFLGALTVSYGVSLLFHPLTANIVAGAYLLRLFLYFGFFAALKLVKKEILEKGLFIFSSLTILFSYLQYFLLPSIKFLEPFGWDPHEFRVFGTFLDVTPAGVIFILLFLWLLLKRHKGALLLIPLILLTYSRITYIGFIFSLLFLLTKNIYAKLVLVILVLFISCIPFLPRPPGESTNLERVFSIEARFIDMRKGIALWQQHPIIGVGYNQIPEYKSSTSSFEDHGKGAYSSSFVTILASSGVLGFGAFIILLWSLFKRKSLLIQVTSGVVSITSLFDNVFLTSFVLAVYLVLVALEDDL